MPKYLFWARYGAQQAWAAQNDTLECHMLSVAEVDEGLRKLDSCMATPAPATTSPTLTPTLPPQPNASAAPMTNTTAPARAPQTAPPSAEASQSGAVGIRIGIGIGSVVVLAGTIGIVLWRRRRAAQSAANEPLSDI